MIPQIGKAYRGPDGTVRWIRGRTSRGRFNVLWLDEERGIWFDGGFSQAGEDVIGDPFPAPGPGDSYCLNTTGLTYAWVIDAEGRHRRADGLLPVEERDA